MKPNSAISPFFYGLELDTFHALYCFKQTKFYLRNFPCCDSDHSPIYYINRRTKFCKFSLFSKLIDRQSSSWEANVLLTELNNSTIHKTSGKICLILLRKRKKRKEKKLINVCCLLERFILVSFFSSRKSFTTKESLTYLLLLRINTISLSYFHLFPHSHCMRYFFHSRVAPLRRQIALIKNEANHKLLVEGEIVPAWSCYASIMDNLTLNKQDFRCELKWFS